MGEPAAEEARPKRKKRSSSLTSPGGDPEGVLYNNGAGNTWFVKICR